MKFIVSQLTSRRDYDVAKILVQEGMLEKLCTDFYYDDNNKMLRMISKIIPEKYSSLLKKQTAYIPVDLVLHDLYAGLRFRFDIKTMSYKERHKYQIRAYKKINENIIKYAGSINFTKGIYGFDTGSLELYRWSKPRGCYLILEQCVAPRATQVRSHETILKKINNVSCINKLDLVPYKILEEREVEEWSLADIIICPSLYVKNELEKAGVASTKLKLINYGYDNLKNSQDLQIIIEKRFVPYSNRKFQVFFAGSDGFRKGIHDVLAIAKRLFGENIIFIIAGNLSKECLSYINKNQTSNIKYVGKLNRNQMQKCYEESDIFLFPSYLEGSALVTYEAMSWGLPLITTYESGSVMEDQKQGFLSNAGDTDKMAKDILFILMNQQIRYELSINSINRLSQFSQENYKENLLKILRKSC